MRWCALLIALAFTAAPTLAHAEASDWGDGVEVMGDAELDASRGGFEVAGVNINFGAVVTTFVNGAPALSTNITWTDVGQVVSETVGNVGENISNMTPEQLQALGLSGLSGTGGVVINDAAGVTALVHNVTEGSLQNIIVNSATGRDLTQNVDVTLTLPGFDAIQNSIALDKLGLQFADDMRGAMD